MSLIHLIYVSSAKKEQNDAELDAILESAVRRNREHDVTGMLLYAGGNFLQVLEGEKANVDKVFAQLEKDSRHHGIIVLERAPIPARSFEQWSMGFHRLDAADATTKPGYAPFFKEGFDATKIGAHPGLALEILLSFSECYDSFQLSDE
jgi:hypothetical protein